MNYNISSIRLFSFIKIISKLIQQKKKDYICVSAVHGAVKSTYNKKYKIAHDKFNYVFPDGRPIYWALKLLGHTDVDHLPGYFVTNEICKLANKKKYKIGIYGSTE